MVPVSTEMNVYTAAPMEGYELCHPSNPKDFELINDLLNGESRRASWKPIGVRIVKEDEGRQLEKSDSPWLGSHALVFRPHALEVLGAMLEEHGEVLPLVCGEANVSVFNPTRVLDALDEAASTVVRFSSGKIMRINRHVFRWDALRGSEIFKIPNLRVSPTFVTEQFVTLWNSAGLRGLLFKHVWPL